MKQFCILIVMVVTQTYTCDKMTEQKQISWMSPKFKLLCFKRHYQENTETISLPTHKTQPREWEEIFANYTSDNGLVARISKERLQLNKKKTNKLVKNANKNHNEISLHTH